MDYIVSKRDKNGGCANYSCSMVWTDAGNHIMDIDIGVSGGHTALRQRTQGGNINEYKLKIILM